MPLFKPIYYNYCFDYCQRTNLQQYILTTCAVALFDKKLKNILWANAEAAKWLAINPLGQKIKNFKILPQIKMMAQKLNHEHSHTAFLKLPTGFLAKSTAFTMTKTSNNEYLLISQPLRHKQFSTKQMAENFVAIMANKNIGTAILDANNNIIAETSAIDKTTINLLISYAKTKPIAKGKIKINNKKIKAHITTIKIAENNFYFLFFPFYKNFNDKLTTINNTKTTDKIRITTNKEITARKFSTKIEPIGNNNLQRWYFKNKPTKENTPTSNKKTIAKTLSTTEAKTFAEIGSQLKGEKINKQNKTKQQMPAAFVYNNKQIENEVDTSILEKLPIAVLAYRDYEILFVNNTFLKISGYENMQELKNAGGLNALFNQQIKENIYHKNGHIINNKIKIETVPWEHNNKAKMLVLQ